MKFFLLAFILFIFFDANAQSLKKITSLPKVLNESSGLLMHSDTTFLSINDSGGEAVIYEFSFSGSKDTHLLIETITAAVISQTKSIQDNNTKLF